ncbi:hamartin [Anaeramoeba ignava]|uniref:Hamartin n=1 Tax=Anaeramoeba ignava TaxID=1746090 RepID=A0A9Q0LUC0_ANAIG|nr:hamartin [Anaeramoeba ignava]
MYTIRAQNYHENKYISNLIFFQYNLLKGNIDEWLNVLKSFIDFKNIQLFKLMKKIFIQLLLKKDYENFHFLFLYYFENDSENVFKIFTKFIKLDSYCFFDQMNQILKHKHYQSVCVNLILKMMVLIEKNQIASIMDTSLFSSLISISKSDKNTLDIISSTWILCIIISTFQNPHLISKHQKDFFQIFQRLIIISNERKTKSQITIDTLKNYIKEFQIQNQNNSFYSKKRNSIQNDDDPFLFINYIEIISNIKKKNKNQLRI